MKTKIKISFIKKIIQLKQLKAKELKAIFRVSIRKLAYNQVSKNIIANLVYCYLFLVYKTSKKRYIGFDNLDKLIKNNESIIFAFWHNRLMMIPFVARRIKHKFDKHNLMTLASRHGDGQLVGSIMMRFGLISILGSSKNGRDSKKGIDYSSLRRIINGLKNGYALGITPDGPRGPSQKINGELLNIAKITDSSLIAISYSCSKFKVIKKSWDKFKIPLPFSSLCFYIDDKLFKISRSSEINEHDFQKINHDLEMRMNYIQDLADKNVDRS